VLPPDFAKAFRELEDGSFDCILFRDVLQHVEDPAGLLSRASRLLAPGGTMLVSLPNFKYVRFLKNDFPYPLFRRWTYPQNGLHTITRKDIASWFRASGLDGGAFRYLVESPRLRKIRASFGPLDVFLGERLIATGRKTGMAAARIGRDASPLRPVRKQTGIVPA
jgi:SAM-dependent methyltransferase